MAEVGSEAETVKCSKMMTLSMDLLCFSGRKASKIGSKWVPGTSSVAGLWVVGFGQWNMGYGQWEMMVPGGQDGKQGCPAN